MIKVSYKELQIQMMMRNSEQLHENVQVFYNFCQMVRGWISWMAQHTVSRTQNKFTMNTKEWHWVRPGPDINFMVLTLVLE